MAVRSGWAIFVAGKRVNLGRFFTVTGVILIFVAAGLVVYAIAEFTEAGYLPVQSPLFDLTGVLPQSSPLGSVLVGMFGYRAAPSAIQVAARRSRSRPTRCVSSTRQRLKSLCPPMAWADRVIWPSTWVDPTDQDLDRSNSPKAWIVVRIPWRGSWPRSQGGRRGGRGCSDERSAPTRGQDRLAAGGAVLANAQRDE